MQLSTDLYGSDFLRMIRTSAKTRSLFDFFITATRCMNILTEPAVCTALGLDRRT